MHEGQTEENLSLFILLCPGTKNWSSRWGEKREEKGKSHVHFFLCLLFFFYFPAFYCLFYKHTLFC